MHNFAKYGLAAALLLGSANLAVAQQNTGIDAGVDAKAGAKMGANKKGAGMGAELDATTTGSIGKQNYGSLISNLQTGASADLTAFDASSSTINCVAVSSLQGNASGNAQALDNALTKNQDQLTNLQAEINGQSGLWSALETSCAASIPGFTLEDVISVETGADGSFTFYIDDRA